jgi:hypothetical protein
MNLPEKQILGTWRIISYEAQHADGTITYPLGQQVQGTITYTPGGYMTVNLMQPDRPRFASGDARNGTPEEYAVAYLGYLAYFGRYEVNAAEGYVTHILEGSLYPDWVGTQQKRFFSFSGNRVTLRTPLSRYGGQDSVRIIVWEKID